MKNNNFSLKSILTLCFISILIFSCSKEEIEEEQILSSNSISPLTLSTNKIVALKSTGGYLSADNTYLICKGSSASDDGEKFQIINHGNDQISLLSLKTGKYVSSEFTRSTGMTANRPSPNAWEKFDVEYQGGNVISLSNTYRGTTKYMCSEGGRADAAFSRYSVGGSWELFTVEFQDEPEVGSSFISTNDGTFQLSNFQIESSSHRSSSDDTSTQSWAYNDFSLSSTWYNVSGGDYYLRCTRYEGKRTEWKEKSGSESSLSSNEAMKYEASITNIPNHGVTIAQMHNRGGVKRPLLRVYIEDGKILVKKTNNDLSNSTGSYDPVTVGPSVSENSKFKVQLTTGSGKVNVKVETSSGTLDEDFYPYTGGNYSDYKNDFYFKAGVYTEGEDIEPLMRFYSFEKS